MDNLVWLRNNYEHKINGKVGNRDRKNASI